VLNTKKEKICIILYLLTVQLEPKKKQNHASLMTPSPRRLLGEDGVLYNSSWEVGDWGAREDSANAKSVNSNALTDGVFAIVCKTKRWDMSNTIGKRTSMVEIQTLVELNKEKIPSVPAITNDTNA
jgi:hypothetical protein